MSEATQTRPKTTYRSVDPAALRPGTSVRHRDGGRAVLTNRKDDDSGWWVEGGGGLADVVIVGGDWTIEWADTIHDTMVRYGWSKRMIGAAMDVAAVVRAAESAGSDG